MDPQLRELERRWKASGTLEDEVAYLQQQLRVGELAEDRLELAAWVGHPAARLLRPQPERDLDAWVSGLVKRWPEVVERVAFAAVWAEAPRWLLLDGDVRARELRQLLDACAAMISTRSPAARDLLTRETTSPPRREARARSLAHLLVDGSEDLRSILPGQDRLVLRTVGLAVGDHVLGRSDLVRDRLDPLDELRERRGELDAPDADLLSLRARAGDLVPGALDVLHLLGYAPAVELLGPPEGSLRALAERVGRLGRTRLGQLALAAAEDRRAAWERRHPGDPAYRGGLEALREWCQDRGPEQARQVARRVEPLNEHAEPPWALLRAALVVGARDLEAATRAAHGVLTWAVAERVVLAGGAFDYALARAVSSDRPDRLAPDVRERLGLGACATIFASRAAGELLDALADELVPLCLRSTSKNLPKGLDADAVEVVPVPLRWVDFLALDEQGAVRRLVDRQRAKELPLKALRTAAMLGSAPARGALVALRADPLEAPDDPLAWCDLIWACGSQAWGHAVLAYLEHESAALLEEGQARWPRQLRDWLSGDARSYTLLKESARWQVQGAGLDRFGQPIDDCDYAPANPDDPRALAVLSLTRQRGFSYQRAARAIGAPDLRPFVAATTIPCLLGYTHTPGSACPPGTAVAAYDPARAFGVGTWLHHATHGLGVVVASSGATLDAQFDTVGRRRLRQQG